ncbi:endoplasmic reticulum aminopeptidase 1-like [Lepisosteus oculatus]|uniref:endoplasmic reticulum aminopeptidase 1-like n=1 Tax=Lepisosteus oculatus TaxID=7918 RepID=UPI003713DDE1
MASACVVLVLWVAGIWEALEMSDAATAVGSSQEQGASFPWHQYRLPRTLVPEQYYIYIHPDLNTNTVTGRVHILMTALNSTTSVVLNGKNLSITEAFLKELTPHHGQESISVRVLESVPNEQLAFISEIPLAAGRKYQLSIAYNTTISTGFSGLYKASYWTDNTIPRILAATQFEPTSARKAFPCFDDPSMKAVFSIVVVRDYNNKAISNMPKVKTKPRADGLLEDHFLHSVRMSSYLVAFVISDFTSNGTKSKYGTRVSVYAPPNQIDQTSYALDVAVKILEFFEEYFQIRYPLPKIDLVAIPEFESGAMENWGLVTFRETSLLYDPMTSSEKNRLWIMLVTAHEFAHQWFGNLVTMQWWNDLWLNEGFGNYMQFIAADKLEPSWCVEDQLLIVNVYRALERDSFSSSHPISLPVKNSQQIRQMFDIVSYCKGASILRMIQSYLNETVFTAGIRAYLKQHSYSNAQQDDLWSALTKSALEHNRRVNVKAIMDTWTKQKGYPVVSVQVSGQKVKLQQDIFTLYPQNGTGFLWQIPFTFYSSTSSSATTYLMKKKEELISLPHEVAWIKANVNSTGFYRVSYDLPTLHALVRQLQERHTVFSRIDRASLIDDAFHLASQGSLQYSESFALSLYLKHEEEYLPIRMFVSHMGKIMSKLSFGRQRCVFHLIKTHLWDVLERQIRARSFDDSGSLPQQDLRVLLLSLASGMPSLPVRQRAQNIFHSWMANDGKIPLPRTLRGLIFREGVRRGGHREWMFVLQKYLRSVSSTEKALLLAALSSTRNLKKKIWLLNAALQNQAIKTQDFIILVSRMAGSLWSNELVWRFVRSHWEELVEKFSLGSSYLSHIVNSVISRFSSTEKYNEVYNFFVSQKKLGHLAFVEQSLEIIRLNMMWLKRNTGPIKAWLQKKYSHSYVTYRYCRNRTTYRYVWGGMIQIHY